MTRHIKCLVYKSVGILSFAALLTLSVSIRPSTVLALSSEDEAEMGREFVTQVKMHFQLLDDDFANRYFTALGQYLLTAVETKHFHFHFYIIKDKTLNAFAGPGGHIFFYSGLIDAMDSVDELASILCHEIGHVSARHLATRLEQNKKIGLATLAGVLAGALIGGEATEALVLGSIAAGVQTQLYYSRNDERQADQLGFKYMMESGFEPGGLIQALTIIEKEIGWMGANQTPPYLLTHPTGPERMANLEAMVSNCKPGKPKEKAERFKESFPLFQTIVRAESLDPQAAEALFQKELKENPNAMTPHLGLGIVHMDQLLYDSAIQHLKIAMEKAPDAVPVLITLGKAYQQRGDDQEAVSVLQKARALSYENGSISYLMGVSYENLEQYDKAIELLEKLTAYDPVKDDVYYHLGMSYGKLNKLLLAHYNFGLYFTRIGQLDKARFHFQKAMELSAEDPAMREKIKKAKEESPRNPPGTRPPS